MLKKCPQCSETKELNSENWHKSCQTRTGYQGICRVCRNLNNKDYKVRNHEEILRKNKEYNIKAKEKRKKYHSEYYKRPKTQERIKKWFAEHKEERKKYIREYIRNKYKNDINYRLSQCIRSLIGVAIKDKNNQRTFDILGYGIQDLRQHLESKFRDGMTWENYGTWWHIDHIIPRMAFKFESYLDEEFKKCWSLQNLQPLLVKENLIKGAKY